VLLVGAGDRSGGGLDVLLSAHRVALGGIAYGLDASPDMLTLAHANAAQASVTNARFLHGHIEDIPLPGGHVDVVISNCVINLSADKPRVLAGAFRVLRPGGRLGISDVTADDGTDPGQLAEAEQQAGCGATLTQAHYRDLLQAAGFTGIAFTSNARDRPWPAFRDHLGSQAGRSVDMIHRSADQENSAHTPPGPGKAMRGLVTLTIS